MVTTPEQRHHRPASRDDRRPGNAETDDRLVGGTPGNVILDLHVLHQRIGELLDVALDGTGVSPAEYAVYSLLGPGPLTPRQIGRRLGVRPSTLTGHLATLTRRGDLERTVHPGDARSYRVALTATGRARLDDCLPRFRHALAELDRRLSAVADVRRTLQEIDRAAAAVVEQGRRAADR